MLLRLKLQPALLPLREHGGQFVRMVDQHIWRRVIERVWRQAVGHSYGINPGIAGGEDINIGVADDDRLRRLNTRLVQQSLHTRGIWLLGVEAFVTVNLKEVRAEAQGVYNGPRGH